MAAPSKQVDIPVAGGGPTASTGGVASWEMFHSNRQAWDATLALCDSARSSVEIEQYIVRSKGIGHRLLDLLAAKARQGVDVRIVADGFGSFGLTATRGARRLRAAGGRLAMFHGAGAILRSPAAAIHRLHRKSIICDGNRMMVGGSCFDPRMNDWRDTMVWVEGSLAAVARLEFEDSWARATGDHASSGPATSYDGGPWRYCVSTTTPPVRHEYFPELIRQIEGAVHRVILTTPYLVPGGGQWKLLEKALVDAVARGVSVYLIFPARSDHAWVDMISRRVARDLARDGIRMCAYEPASCMRSWHPSTTGGQVSGASILASTACG
ncbi:MAG TPA: phospholipase D-like domain-containing protein [Devosiaceae bacterium]|nr:phospholipase D-like domain-containing protein [Devosiaceae bacterium]